VVRRGLALLLTLAAGALAGCGGAASSPALGPGAAAQLHSELARVSTLANAGNRQGALGALATFAAEVNREKSAGHLSASTYDALQTGIARTRAEITAQVHPPTEPVTTPQTVQSTPPRAPTTPPAPRPHPGKAHGGPGGPGKGHGGHGGHDHKGDGGD